MSNAFGVPSNVFGPGNYLDRTVDNPLSGAFGRPLATSGLVQIVNPDHKPGCPFYSIPPNAAYGIYPPPVCTCGNAMNQQLGTSAGSPDTNWAYKLRIKELENDIERLKLQARIKDLESEREKLQPRVTK